jgi:membrane-associated phospholipid phosphatase
MYSLLVIFAAKYLIFINIAIVGIYILLQPRAQWKQITIFALYTFIPIYIISFITGKLYFNPRPFVVDNIIPLVSHGNTNGFPSDHTLLSGALSVLMLKYNKKIGLTLAMFAVIVGVGRVLAGVHHAIDIVASLVICSLIGYLANIVYGKRQNLQKKVTTV